tara:strand:- start:254 stop:466 length:213 start_codon:yes stop_codon:yes gene_type:complete
VNSAKSQAKVLMNSSGIPWTDFAPNSLTITLTTDQADWLFLLFYEGTIIQAPRPKLVEFQWPRFTGSQGQ